MCWLVLGQVYGPGAFIQQAMTPPDIGPERAVLVGVFGAFYFGIATIGGFVVVAKMIYSDQVCIRL